MFVWVVALVWSDLVWDGGNQTEFGRCMRGSFESIGKKVTFSVRSLGRQRKQVWEIEVSGPSGLGWPSV